MSNIINDTLKEQAREEHEENCTKSGCDISPCEHRDCEEPNCDAECIEDIEKRYQNYLTKVL